MAIRESGASHICNAIVSDTSPITNLAAIGQLDLLRRLYSVAIVPVAAYNEMVGFGKIVPDTEEVQTLSWIQTQARYAAACHASVTSRKYWDTAVFQLIHHRKNM